MCKALYVSLQLTPQMGADMEMRRVANLTSRLAAEGRRTERASTRVVAARDLSPTEVLAAAACDGAAGAAVAPPETFSNKNNNIHNTKLQNIKTT